MDAAEYKHVFLGLVFLKYISDALEEQHARLGQLIDLIGDTFHDDRHLAWDAVA